MTNTICPACGEPVRLVPLRRPGAYRMAEPDCDMTHGYYCPELVLTDSGGYKRCRPLQAPAHPVWVDKCRNGHSLMVYGRTNSRGAPYCQACRSDKARRSAEHAAQQGRREHVA